VTKKIFKDETGDPAKLEKEEAAAAREIGCRRAPSVADSSEQSGGRTIAMLETRGGIEHFLSYCGLSRLRHPVTARAAINDLMAIGMLLIGPSVG